MLTWTWTWCVVAACLWVAGEAAAVPRVVNGSDASIEDFPWMASILFRIGHKCGGSIISDSWVLTSAECVQKFKPEDYFVRVGSSTLDSGGLVYNVTEIAHHNKYSSSSQDYDIGAARVLGTFTFTDSVQPVPLTTVEPQAGELVTIAGWGTIWSGSYLPDQLQAVDLYIVARADCSAAYDGLGKVSERKICAWWPGGGKDRCGPDYGGPMVLDGVQVGVISSWGNGCAIPGWPSVYANVAVLRDWIADTTGV